MLEEADPRNVFEQKFEYMVSTFRTLRFFLFFWRNIASCYAKFVCLLFLFHIFGHLYLIEKLKKKACFSASVFEFSFFGRHYSLEIWQ